jgi:hypothetical protein
MRASKYVVMQQEEGRHETERTWKPIAAGILSIILGAIFLIPGIVSFTALRLILSIIAVSSSVLWGFLVVVPGIMPIVGGIYALRRRRWGVALAGSIVTLLNCAILAIFGTILLIIFPLGYVDNPGAHFELSDWATLGIYIIVGLTIFGILGLLALIFVIRARREFR